MQLICLKTDEKAILDFRKACFNQAQYSISWKPLEERTTEKMVESRYLVYLLSSLLVFVLFFSFKPSATVHNASSDISQFQNYRRKFVDHMSLSPSMSFHGTERLLPSVMEIKYRKLVPELYRDIPQPPKSSKVIVIGSGFGGAISAYRLAKAGIQLYWNVGNTGRLTHGVKFTHMNQPAMAEDYGTKTLAVFQLWAGTGLYCQLISLAVS